MCYGGVVLLLSIELVPPLLLQAHHFAGVRCTCQFYGSAESPARSVRLHCLLEAPHLLVQVSSFLVQTSTHQRAGNLLQEVVLRAKLLAGRVQKGQT